MYIKWLNSKIFLVINVALVSYRDLNLQNANKIRSIQDFAIISTLIYNSRSLFIACGGGGGGEVGRFWANTVKFSRFPL